MKIILLYKNLSANKKYAYFCSKYLNAMWMSIYSFKEKFMYMFWSNFWKYWIIFQVSIMFCIQKASKIIYFFVVFIYIICFESICFLFCDIRLHSKTFNAENCISVSSVIKIRIGKKTCLNKKYFWYLCAYSSLFLQIHSHVCIMCVQKFLTFFFW